MSLKKSSSEILQQLIGLLNNMESSQFNSPINSLSENSIGDHVRHIIEFYQGLIKGKESGMINYDNRQRNNLLATDRYYALKTLLYIITEIDHIDSDQRMKISLDLSKTGNPVIIDTTFNRELAYNIEHAIHHMAIIRIGLQSCYPAIVIDDSFGVAYATIKSKEKECAQ